MSETQMELHTVDSLLTLSPFCSMEGGTQILER